jgi:hypothetical protein
MTLNGPRAMSEFQSAFGGEADVSWGTLRNTVYGTRPGLPTPGTFGFGGPDGSVGLSHPAERHRRHKLVGVESPTEHSRQRC